MAQRVTALETRFDTILPTLATKSDIETLRVEMGEIRVDIQKTMSDAYNWALATAVGIFLGFGGLFMAMSTALKPVSGASSAPVIIQVPIPTPASK